MKKMFLLGAVFFGIVWNVWAVELKVVDGTITTAIEQQMPVDQIHTYPADFGKLYYFTRIVGAIEPTEITHVWLYQEQEMARVILPVNSPDWRTYSSKRFLPQWAGKWTVKVLDAQGQELADHWFYLE